MEKYKVGDKFKIPSQWLAPGQTVYGVIKEVHPMHVVVVREDTGREQKFPAVTKGSNFSNGTKTDKQFPASSRVKQHRNFNQDDYNYLRNKGWDDAKILQRWDEEAGQGKGPTTWKKAPNVTGVVGNPNFYKNGRAKAEQLINSKMAAVGIKVVNWGMETRRAIRVLEEKNFDAIYEGRDKTKRFVKSLGFSDPTVAEVVDYLDFDFYEKKS